MSEKKMMFISSDRLKPVFLRGAKYNTRDEANGTMNGNGINTNLIKRSHAYCFVSSSREIVIALRHSVQTEAKIASNCLPNDVPSHEAATPST